MGIVRGGEHGAQIGQGGDILGPYGQRRADQAPRLDEQALLETQEAEATQGVELVRLLVQDGPVETIGVVQGPCLVQLDGAVEQMRCVRLPGPPGE